MYNAMFNIMRCQHSLEMANDLARKAGETKDMKDTSPANLFTFVSDCGVAINPKLYDRLELRVPKGGVRHPSMCYETLQAILDILQGALHAAYFKENLSRVVRDRPDLYDEALATQQPLPASPTASSSAHNPEPPRRTAEAASNPILQGDAREYEVIAAVTQYTFDPDE